MDDRILDQLVLHAVVRKAKKGTVIFRKGDAGSNLFVVSAGAVRISVPSEQGKDAVLNLIIPGEVFGEIAFLDGKQRAADAVAVENCELVVIERRDFMPLLQKYPEIATRLLEILCDRLRRTSEQVEDIVFFGIEVRLAKALLYLYRHAAPGSPKHQIRITQREISEMIGASRESTNRVLRGWQRRKWLKVERASLTIIAPQALTALIPESAG
jgi:CRP-like cAMP-binding protein